MINPHLFTHLFHEGIIITTKKMVYDPDADPDVIRALMQAQHKSVLRELKNGKFDDKIDRYLGRAPGSEAPAGDGSGVSAIPTAVEIVEVSLPAEGMPSSPLLMEAEPPSEAELPLQLGGLPDVPQPVTDDPTQAMPGIPASMAREVGLLDTVRPTDLHLLELEGTNTLRESIPAHVSAGASVPTSYNGPVPAAADWADSEAQSMPLPPSRESGGGSWEITEPAAADTRPPGVVAFRPPATTHVREPARDDPPPVRSAQAPSSTAFVAKPGQKERPFEKSGKFAAVSPPEGVVRAEVPKQESTQYSQVRRKSAAPPEEAAPLRQGPKARQTGGVPVQGKAVAPSKRPTGPTAAQTGSQKPVSHPWITSPEPPPSRAQGKRGTNQAAKLNQTLFAPGAPPPRAVPSGQRPAPGVVARPAVIIGAPPTPVGAQPTQPQGARRGAREQAKPSDSIFGQDRLSEKSLDEVILAYLSEDAKED